MSNIDNLFIGIVVLAFIVTFFVTRLAIKFALGHSMFDEPDERKIHHGNIPRIGGTVFVPVALLFTILAGCINLVTLTRPVAGHTLFSIALQLIAVLLLFGVGCIDDVKGLRYRVKFLAQFAVGVLFCASGLYVDNMHGILGIYELPKFCGWAITVFAVIYCTNAINFIDGVDGQSSLLTIVSLCYYYVMLSGLGGELQIVFAPMCVLLAVCLLAFVRYNYFGSEKKGQKTFMGDAGSLTLGTVMVMMGLYVNSFDMSSSHGGDATFIKAFAPLFLPCLDVVRVVLHRVRFGLSPFAADKNHIHHKLLACGIAPRKVSLIVVAIHIAVIVASVILVDIVDANLVILILLVVWTLSNMWITKKMKENNKNKA